MEQNQTVINNREQSDKDGPSREWIYMVAQLLEIETDETPLESGSSYEVATIRFPNIEMRN